MLESMDAVELAEWEAIALLIEPLPEARADLRMGILAANSLAPLLKKGTPMPKPSDFIPRFDGKQKPKQSMAEMKQQWKQACKAMNRGRSDA